MVYFLHQRPSRKVKDDYWLHTFYQAMCIRNMGDHLYIWCPVRLLCWLYTLSFTSQEYSLKLCLSILDCAYVKIQFWKMLAFHWHYSIGYSFAEVWSLLLLNIWTELRTECMDVAARYLWLMLVWVMQLVGLPVRSSSWCATCLKPGMPLKHLNTTQAFVPEA